MSPARVWLAAVDARAFTSLADWFFELGQDQHSQTADPLFVDPDGADDLLGYVWGLGAQLLRERVAQRPAGGGEE